MKLMDLNEEVDRDFGRAVRRAWRRRLVLRLRGKPSACGASPLFAEVRGSLRAFNQLRLGTRVVDPGEIVGSVGRNGDFDACFMPLRGALAERWKRVDLAFHQDRVLPPVSLYKVGDAYFVEDGNHRVSVARFHGVPALDAEVTELQPAWRGSLDAPRVKRPEKRAA